MASLISEISKTMKRHIITVEDPIEYIFENNLSIIEQREV
ncbi:MAG: type IV pilus twitching motility protein PilT [Candidatus Peribacteria bacterium]|jgi:twitching motility protein PilT|nr:type IV pilus twitching motility protein PilT [Candidatus Peribacteria bacterium]